MPKQIHVPSLINYNYSTIKMTRSRIEYGLLAVPINLLNMFPKDSSDLYIYFDDSKVLRKKSFVLSEKNREARVYGLSEWYNKNSLIEGDEIVIQLLNQKENIYRFVTEKRFIEKNTKIQTSFDKSTNEINAESNLANLSDWNKIEPEQTALREVFRLSKENLEERKRRIRRNVNSKETVSPQLRISLLRIYQGVCQVCQFWFLKKDNNPYFEIHHLNALYGNHPKNLLLVCANCHRQFEFANVKKEFDIDGWLNTVIFNQKKYHINQAITKVSQSDIIKTIYV